MTTPSAYSLGLCRPDPKKGYILGKLQYAFIIAAPMTSLPVCDTNAVGHCGLVTSLMSSKDFNDDPLAVLTHISNSPYYFYPGPCSAPATEPPLKASNDPDLILLCSWMDASWKHIMKYIHAYRALYPSSPILLARTFSSDFFLVSESALQRKLKPAVEIICAQLQSGRNYQSNRTFLAHALSNGGSGHLTCLARQYHEDTGHPLPVNAMILDSTPTGAHFQSLVASLSLTLPSAFLIRLPAKAVIMVLVFIFYVLPTWMGKGNMAARVCDDLNSLEGGGKSQGRTKEWLRKEAIRTYIYSDTDEICRAENIMPHARVAANQGMRVREEAWVGSGHVAHMKTDPDRYWKVVAGTWDDRS